MKHSLTALSLHHVDIGYGTQKVVHDVHFDVAQGESFALVGESGSGKSTLLRAISGLSLTWQGTISIFAQPRQQGQFSRHFAQQCQMVFQDPYGALHPRKTIYSTLKEPLIIHRVPDKKNTIYAILEKVGLNETILFRFPHQLSGGQRQRVAIARALILRPRILLLDEPTSALDVSVQADILNMLKRLRQEEGLTYILVTHDFAIVQFLCDRMAIMKQGRIVETANVEALNTGAFNHPYSRMLYQASITV